VGASFVPSPTAEWDRGFERAYDLATPFGATPETVAAGRAIYRERCVACHGDRGRGDGPAGAALLPWPADLVLHVPQHTEGELFYYVSRGIPGTAMPAWDRVLSERERWEVVHYLYALAAGAP
jgi:copper transport protein